ncbi:PREDICTED: uncharacterized protein LOC109151221 [Ipomoea nil]|uniref:uncharacterized protein LOC109151221 n=1 Tax=Ipomoea nil TaxID=35883 RepID=UPI0009010E5E|nr:PREDICTED: uncharacterized protein LOC109151221 [Ipomoea nil]
MGSGKRKYLIVAVDYFTKWVEAEPAGNHNKCPLQALCVQKYFVPFWGPDATHHRQRTPIRGARVRGVLCRMAHYSQPGSCVLPSSKWPGGKCQPHHRGRPEKETGIRRGSVGGGARRHSLGLPHHPRRATGETPFSLAYGFEARAPAEVVIPSRREEDYDPDTNEEHHRIDLHMIDDRREAAAIRAENYQSRPRRITISGSDPAISK